MGCLDMDSSGSSDAQVVLSEEEKARVASRARRGLLGILLWQTLASLLVAVLFLLFSGVAAALSALAGSVCYLAPSALFALRLTLSTFKPGGAGAGVFLVGNGLKVLVAVGLLWLMAEVGGDRVNWVAALIGLVAALKGYWVGLVFSGGRLKKMI